MFFTPTGSSSMMSNNNNSPDLPTKATIADFQTLEDGNKYIVRLSLPIMLHISYVFICKQIQR